MQRKKIKIINDPIYGFIQIDEGCIFDVVEHPYFQRLRNIKQLGLTHLVYPGAMHTRFHHALGAMHLMSRAIDVLRDKGVEILEEEASAAKTAILLHDIGHGPFSHVLEHSILHEVPHEYVSGLFMNQLNKEFDGKLTMAIEIFKGSYQKRFLHQLVSSQLDTDRLDYLTRDSFYTGVSEGIVGLERIIQMLNVVDDQLVIDEKGIYSVEKFIMARRLMYWQVYFHKTALAADAVLLNIFKRVRLLLQTGSNLFVPPNLRYFLEYEVDKAALKKPEVLTIFSQLDDADIHSSIKSWQGSDDSILSLLCCSLIQRKLFKTTLQTKPFTAEYIEGEKKRVMYLLNLDEEEVNYFIYVGKAANKAYQTSTNNIMIKRKNGELIELSKASDNYNFSSRKQDVVKYFICTPK